jgi:hypothetical protein
MTHSHQAQLAYEAAISSPCPDWRAVAELFRAALPAARKREPRSKAPQSEVPPLADYNVDRIKLKCRSPRIAVRFMDGEAVFTHVPSAPRKPLNIGRALRVAIAMYRSRKAVRQRLGFREYDPAMPVPEIFQVRCLETDELFDVEACNAHTARDRASSDPERAAAQGREQMHAGSLPSGIEEQPAVCAPSAVRYGTAALTRQRRTKNDAFCFHIASSESAHGSSDCGERKKCNAQRLPFLRDG